MDLCPLCKSEIKKTEYQTKTIEECVKCTWIQIKPKKEKEN